MATATVDLTTFAKVKTHAGKTDADDDVLIQELITSVSTQFEGYCRRTLAQVTSVQTIYRPGVLQSVIVLDEWPNATPVITQDGTALVEDTDYEILDDRRLVKITSSTGNALGMWTSGARLDVTVHEGYATVPEDLALACREQTLFAFRQTDAGGNQRIGISDRTSTTGEQETFTEYGFLRNVLDILQRYRRTFP